MAEKQQPSVTVVTPVYQDPEGLDETLRTAVNQDYPSYEIVVVVTPVDGNTLSTAQSYANRYPDLVSVHKEERKGAAAARNTGIEHATGDVIAFLDADIRVEQTWLQNAVDELIAREANYLACDIRFPETDGRVGLVERYDRAMALPAKHYIEEYNFAVTACLFVTRELIDDVGQFDARLSSSEDKEFGNRVSEAGYDLHYTSSVSVTHPLRSTFKAQYNKALRIGRGLEQLKRYYPRRYSNPSLVSPLAYVPPSPNRVRDRMNSNSYSASFFPFLQIYFLEWILKLAQQYGRIRESRSAASQETVAEELVMD